MTQPPSSPAQPPDPRRPRPPQPQSQSQPQPQPQPQAGSAPPWRQQTPSPAWPPSAPAGGSAGPGWYPDTVGDSAAFRWWDGSWWTQAVSDSLWAPEPRDPAPYVPAARPMSAMPTTPIEFELDEDEPRVSKPLLIGIGVAAVIVLVVLGMVAFGGGGGDEPATAGGPERGSSEHRPDGERSGGGGGQDSSDTGKTDGADNAEDSGESADGGDTGDGSEQSPRPGGPVAGWPAFESPGEDWWTGDQSVLPHATVRHFTTEEDYRADDDWIATVMAGEIPEEVEPDPELAKTAAKVADWYAGVAFGPGRTPEFETVQNEPTMVADRPAHRLKVRMPYELKGLEATSDDVDVVVIDLGPDRRPGLFLAAVPNTNPELWEICDSTRGSLTLE